MGKSKKTNLDDKIDKKRNIVGGKKVVFITLAIEEDLMKEINQLKEKEYVPKRYIIKKALESYLGKLKSEERKIFDNTQ